MPVYRVSLLQSLFGQQMMNVLHYDVNAALSSNDALEWADSFRDAYIDSNMTMELANDWSFVGCEFRRVDLADQPSIEVAPPSGTLSGGQSGQVLPTQVALLVSSTAFTTFPRRARMYIPGLTEASVADSLWGVNPRNRALQFAEAILEMVGTAWSADRVAVRYADEGDGPVVVAFNRLTANSVSIVPATQRRRRIGVGS